MIVAVDTCVLLDILKGDEPFCKESYDRLNDILRRGKLIISEIVGAELGTQFETAQRLNQFFTDTRIEVISSSVKSLFMAGQVYSRYLSKRKIVCTHCGKPLEDMTCPTCSSDVKLRQHLLADFLIASHAYIEAESLLTRDRGYYETYFPELKLYT